MIDKNYKMVSEKEYSSVNNKNKNDEYEKDIFSKEINIDQGIY